MAADFWASTQRMHWQFTRESLQGARKELKLLETTMEQSELISTVNVQYDLYMRVYIHSLVNKLGRRLSVRQIALSTAEVYLIRFLTKVSLKEVNIYLLVTTCIYLSCKIEECPQHIRTIVSEARNLWPEYIPHDATKVAEFEFYLIEELDTYLVIHHPYRSLMLISEVLTAYNQLQKAGASGTIDNSYNNSQPSIHITSHTSNPYSSQSAAVNNGTSTQALSLTPEELQSSWSIINDSYATDLPLIFPPHIIAAASIYLTMVLKHNHFKNLQKEALKNSKTPPVSDDVLKTDSLRAYIQFLGYSNVDLGEVIEAVQEMITLYEVWETYDEGACKKPLETVLLNR